MYSFSNVLIIIEAEYYQTKYKFQLLSEQNYAENFAKKSNFWEDVSKYASCVNDDESFVSEIAYMMVTLHRTGA